MTYLSRNKGYKDQVEKNQVKERYKKAFGYGEGGGDSDGATLIDGANFDGKYGVYFDCYKKGKKTHLRMFVDKNGDGEYSGENEFIAYSRKLNQECANYCEDLDKGSLTMTYDIVKNYSEDSQRDYKRAYRNGEDGYGFTREKVSDGYGGYYYEKTYYKEEIDCVKIGLKSYYYKEVCKEYDDYGYGDGGKYEECDYEKKKCKTVFKIDGPDYLENFEMALG